MYMYPNAPRADPPLRLISKVSEGLSGSVGEWEGFGAGRAPPCQKTLKFGFPAQSFSLYIYSSIFNDIDNSTINYLM